MSTQAFGRISHADVRVWHGLSVHWAWLAGGFVLAFAVPYVLADVFAINRLNDLGSKGWEVVAMYDRVVILKREQPPLEDPRPESAGAPPSPDSP
jgi:hypothetical protein